MNRIARIALVLGAVLAIALAGSASAWRGPKVDICHAVPPDTAADGWIAINIDQDGALGHAREHDADIIPAFSSGEDETFDGKNLDTLFSGVLGSDILKNGCVLPEPTTQPTPEPTVEPTPEPTTEPTTEPTPEPTVEPTPEPTTEPSVAPSEQPSAEPSATPEGTAEPVVATPKPDVTLPPTSTDGGNVALAASNQDLLIILVFGALAFVFLFNRRRRF